MDGAREPQPKAGVPNGLYIFSSAANSAQGSSTPTSFSDGRVSTSTPEKCLAVTLMYNYTHGKKVVFLEAGKDFVDLLLGVLTLPLGGIIKLLYGGSDLSRLDGAIYRVFNSVEKMEDERFCTSKTALLNPQAAAGFRSNLLQADSEQELRPSSSSSNVGGGGVFYSCGMVPHCVCITKKLGRRCPRHGRKMQTLCRFADGTQESSSSSMEMFPVKSGYVKDGRKFFITDNLEVHPSSKALELLHKLKVEKMSLLRSLDMFVGMDEILKLLKASLTSTTVLQDVFGKLVQERLPPPPPPSNVSIATTTNTSESDGIARIMFASGRTRPKYDDYFPRPTGSMFW